MPLSKIGSLEWISFRPVEAAVNTLFFDTKNKVSGKALDGVVYYNKDLSGVVEDIGASGLSQTNSVFA